MMRSSAFFPKILLSSALLCFSLSGCFSSRQMIVDNALGLFRQVALSANRQADTTLVRQGLPSYLMMIDGIIRSYPENQEILLAGAQAYASYASLLDEDDSARTALMIDRAKNYALKALGQDPLFPGGGDISLELFQQRLPKAEKKDVPLLFGVGSIWGTWIVLGPDPVEGMADLPKVEALMERTLQLDPGFYYGGPHLFKAMLLASKPAQFGGDLKQAEVHFKQALAYSQNKFLMTRVYFAQYYARQRLDQGLFVSTLNQVLDVPADIEPDLTLINTLAQEKAKKLLGRTEEYF